MTTGTKPKARMLLAATGIVLAGCSGGAVVGAGTSPYATPTPGMVSGSALTGTATAGSATASPASTTPRPSSRPSRGALITPSVLPPASPTPLPVAGSGVRGTVEASPTCPVERPDHPCPARPVQAQVTARNLQGATAGTTRSLADGRYALALPAGHYTLSADPGAVFPRCAPTAVTVAPGQVVMAAISCDTGIR
ncbi:MAG: hypothetical protein NVSMB32_18780 [Actinomycetota bacterium]